MRKTPLHLNLATALATPLAAQAAPRPTIVLAETLDKATLAAAAGIPGNLTCCFARVAAEK